MKPRFSLFPRSFSKLYLCLFGVLLCLAFSGCETTDSGVEQDTQTPTTVSKGMTEAQVIAILGEPHKVEEIEQSGVVAQVWHYQREVVLSSTIESNGEEERSYIDHKTGNVVTVREPIYRNERVMGTLTAELLMIEGKVVALKESEGVAEFEVGAGR